MRGNCWASANVGHLAFSEPLSLLIHGLGRAAPTSPNLDQRVEGGGTRWLRVRMRAREEVWAFHGGPARRRGHRGRDRDCGGCGAVGRPDLTNLTEPQTFRARSPGCARDVRAVCRTARGRSPAPACHSLNGTLGWRPFASNGRTETVYGIHPKSPDDYLGFLALAQIHGYPLLFAPNAEGARDRRRGPRKQRGFGIGLVTTAFSRRRPAAELGGCATC
jgi:hypothetical protein